MNTRPEKSAANPAYQYGYRQLVNSAPYKVRVESEFEWKPLIGLDTYFAPREVTKAYRQVSFPGEGGEKGGGGWHAGRYGPEFRGLEHSKSTDNFQSFYESALKKMELSDHFSRPSYHSSGRSGRGLLPDFGHLGPEQRVFENEGAIERRLRNMQIYTWGLAADNKE